MVLVYLLWNKYPEHRPLLIAWDLTWLSMTVFFWALCFVMPAIRLLLEKPILVIPTLLCSLYAIVFAVVICYGVKFLWSPWSPWKNK